MSSPLSPFTPRSSLSSLPLSHAVFAFGDTWLGSLGIHEPARRIATPEPVAALPGGRGVSASAGWGHSAFVDEAGNLVLTGRPCDFRNTLRHINTHGGFPRVQRMMTVLSRVIFNADTRPELHRPLVPPGEKTVDGDDRFVKTVCGLGALTAAITETGRLHMVGANFYGQCGVGRAGHSDICFSPEPVVGIDYAEGDDGRPGDPVVDVAVGFEHALAVTASGALYAWGRGNRGQLGLGIGQRGAYHSAVRVLGPSDAFLDTRVTRVSACLSSSAALTEAGGLYVWGKGQGTALTDDPDKRERNVVADALAPRLLAGPEGLDAGATPLAPLSPAAPCAIAAAPPGLTPADVEAEAPSAPVVGMTVGQAYLAFLTADGKLWMTGFRGRGVLYDTDEGAEDGSSGGGATTTTPPAAAAPAATVTTAGPPLPELYQQITPLRILPGELAGQSVVGLRSGLHHVYALTASGRVYRWGWRGVVQRLAATAALEQQARGGVLDLALGYCHGLALTAAP